MATVATDVRYNLKEVIALAWAHSEQGQVYVGVQAETDGGVSTTRRVRNSLEYITESNPDYYHRKSLESAAYQCNEALIADILQAADDLPNNTYCNRLRGALNRSVRSGEVADTDLNMVVSVVRLYAQARAEGAFPVLPPGNGFVGSIHQTIKNLRLEVRAVHYWDDPQGNTRTILTATTDTGKVVVWRAWRVIDVIPHQRITVMRAKVKEHRNYRGTDQTTLTSVYLAPGCEGGYTA
jgi:hypothetical protein